jgi:1,4-dihydroxy-2-naphthoate octaprenyltransferase
MFGVWSRLLTDFAGILLTGIAIKIMDDFLDIEYDQCLGKRTLAIRLGRASLPYTMLLLALGSALSLSYSLSLFLGSYAVGMTHDWAEKMPTRLPGYAEMAGAFLVSIFIVGFVPALWGVTMMATVQLLDDIFDIHKDSQTGQRNMVLIMGMVETTLLLLIFFLVSVLLNAMGTVLVLLALPFVHMILEFTGGHKP